MGRHTEIRCGNSLQKAHFQNKERDGKAILMWILMVICQAGQSVKPEVLTVVVLYIPVFCDVTLSLG
jgi:hypothetical protein